MHISEVVEFSRYSQILQLSSKKIPPFLFIKKGRVKIWFCSRTLSDLR